MRCTTPPETQRVRPLYRREHEARGAQGFLGDEKVELLDGRIVMAAEEGGAHAAIVRRLARSPFEAIPANEGEVGVGNPLALDNRSEPEPDLMVVAPAHTYHHAHHTTASLVVEVAQPSRATDLKAALYAGAGMPDYWVVDLAAGAVVLHREPADQAYASVTRHRDGVVRPLRRPGAAVDLERLLGRTAA